MPTPLHELKWSDSEKKAARRIFESALTAELAELLATLKQRAAQATSPEDLWQIESFLSAARREIDRKYDYRHSRLIFLLARLLREGRLAEGDLAALSEQKQSYIRSVASL